MAHTVLYQDRCYNQGVICLNEKSEVVSCEAFKQETPFTRFYEGILLAVATDFPESDFLASIREQQKTDRYTDHKELLLRNDLYSRFLYSKSQKYSIYQLLIQQGEFVLCKKIG